MHMCILVADNGNIYELLDRFTNYCYDKKPESRFDYFGIGGNYEGALPLREPRKLRKFFGLIPAGETSHVSVAKKSEIDEQAFLVDPPAALFFQDKLYECPMFADGEALKKWQDEFRSRYAEIPYDNMLQIVDAHI